MKPFFVRLLLLSLHAAVVLIVCFWGQAEHHWFGWSMGPACPVLWPAIVLSAWDLTHTWVVVAVGVPLVVALLAWWLRSLPWVAVPGIGVLFPTAYCLVGRLVFVGLDVPTPSLTPYDSEPRKRQEYLETWSEGYLHGVTALHRTYCFAPEHTTRGFYQGRAEGAKRLDRVLGRRSQADHSSHLIRAWTRTDGVKDDPTKAGVEPDGPANRSQPIRSQTNPASSAAGSRR